MVIHNPTYLFIQTSVKYINQCHFPYKKNNFVESFLHLLVIYLTILYIGIIDVLLQITRQLEYNYLHKLLNNRSFNHALTANWKNRHIYLRLKIVHSQNLNCTIIIIVIILMIFIIIIINVF